jgi:hypothetical protein
MLRDDSNEYQHGVSVISGAMRRMAQPNGHIALDTGLAGLARTQRMLSAVNRKVRTANGRAPSPATHAALAEAHSRVAREIAAALDIAGETAAAVDRYRVGIERLLRTHACIEAKLDVATLDELGWYEQMVRLAHLRLRLAAGDRDP